MGEKKLEVKPVIVREGSRVSELENLKGAYAVTNIIDIYENQLKELFEKVKELEKGFQKVSYKHVLRNHPKIQRADELVNEALDGRAQTLF